MSIFAEHSLGFFNLWLLMLLYMLPIFLIMIFRKGVFQSTAPHFSSLRGSQEYKLFVGAKFLMLAYFLYAVVIPLRLDTPSAQIGVIIYIIGFTFYSAAWITIAKSKPGEMFSEGAFRFSRHPVYVSSAIVFLGAGFISQSWLFLGLSLLVGLSHMRNAFAEEKICLEVFGDEYRRYMLGTPRWLGWPAQKPHKDK